MKIGILVIDNGLGHLRRQSVLANHLSVNGHEVSIYCNIDNAKKFYFKDKIQMHNLSIKLDDILEGYEPKGKLNLILYKNYDLFISDNLVDVLEFNPNCIIFGSFFWHRSIKVSLEYYQKCEYLLNKYEPIIIANKYFAPDYIKNNKNVQLIGLFSDFNNTKKDFTLKKDILISTGLGGKSNLISSDLLDFCEILSNRIGNTIWLEPRFFYKFKSKSFKMATYDKKMYQKIRVAIVRPGLGTVSDLLACECIIIPVYENKNKEMKHNAKILKSLGHFNCKVSKIHEILETIFFNDNFIFKPYKLKFKGEQDTLYNLKKIM